MGDDQAWPNDRPAAVAGTGLGERSFAGIERLVETIDRLSMERKVAATQSIWRDALDSVRGPEQGRLL
ncbi:hypothetical protein J4558_03130 [Leptolyngbya sp. 15MV]|nr:hypothetical protein J4558_03130 [Leptolyngbya sp. 15MV]